MTWDLNDKFLALSLWQDNELTPEERAQVDARLAADADWRETLRALRETERKLAATLTRHLASAPAAEEVAPTELDQSLTRVISAHRLDEAGFPAEVAARVFESSADRWLTRVLRAHRLDDKFVAKVIEARAIESFQEPLDAQLSEALKGHRVGTAFVEKVVGETQRKARPVADVPVVLIADAAAAQLERRRTPTKPVTPARGSSSRASSGRRKPLPMNMPAVAAVAPVAGLRPGMNRWRWMALASAAVVLIGLGFLLFHGSDTDPRHTPGLVASTLDAVEYSRAINAAASDGSTAPVQHAGNIWLGGYTAVGELNERHRSVSSGSDAGRVVALFDPNTRATIARIVLDANTSAQFYGPGETAPNGERLERGGVVLESGALLADVEKAKSNFVVLTGGSAGRNYDRVTVHGTRFFVHAEKEVSRVDVLEGLVSFVPGAPLNAGGEPMVVTVHAVTQMLPSGSRFTWSHDEHNGGATLQRADPSDIFYAFAPRELAVSGWVQAGGGLERGGVPLEGWQVQSTPVSMAGAGATVVGAPVVVEDVGFKASPMFAGFMSCVTRGEHGELCRTVVMHRADGTVTTDTGTMASRTGRLIGGPVVFPRGQVAIAIDHRVEAFDMDGHSAWQIDLPAGEDLYALSAGPRGRAILSTSHGLQAYDGATGAFLWSNHDVGEITSGVAATERAEVPFILAYDSIRARLYKLDAEGAVLKTIDFRAADAAPTAQTLARDIKDWTLYETPMLVGDNCVLVFEDGATALVNLTTGVARMTAGFGAAERVRLATLDRASVQVTVLLQSGAVWRCDLNGAAAAPVKATVPAATLTGMAVNGDTALGVSGGQLVLLARK